MKQKKVLIPVIVVFFFIIGASTFYFFSNDLKQFFAPKDANVPGGAIAKDEPLVTCGAGDKACTAKNEKIMANRLDGPIATFASHQCDGPRACPTPNEEETKAITEAIKASAKSPNLKLIRFTGITPAGMIYYCAPDERCWSYNTKTKKASLLSSQENIQASSSAK